MFPFSINNNSHLFNIRDIQWRCHFLTLKDNTGQEIFSNMYFSLGSEGVIRKGENLNISCMEKGKLSFIKFEKTPNIIEGKVEIELQYKIYIIGDYYFSPKINPTTFTWFGMASNPQWIKGETAK